MPPHVGTRHIPCKCQASCGVAVQHRKRYRLRLRPWDCAGLSPDDVDPMERGRSHCRFGRRVLFERRPPDSPEAISPRGSWRSVCSANLFQELCSAACSWPTTLSICDSCLITDSAW